MLCKRYCVIDPVEFVVGKFRCLSIVNQKDKLRCDVVTNERQLLPSIVERAGAINRSFHAHAIPHIRRQSLRRK
jgi:hypothetical protein